MVRNAYYSNNARLIDDMSNVNLIMTQLSLPVGTTNNGFTLPTFSRTNVYCRYSPNEKIKVQCKL